MSVSKLINVEIKSDDGSISREETYNEEQIERIGGIGSVIETIEPLLRNDETIIIKQHYYE